MYTGSDIAGAQQRSLQQYEQYREANPPSPDFGKEPIALADALRLRTHEFANVPESAFDGNSSLLLKHEGNNRAEFKPGTDVFVVNGINTDFGNAAKAANAYAKAIGEDVHLIHASTSGSIEGDLFTSLKEKGSQAIAFELPPEKSVAEAVLSHLQGGSDPAHAHFTGDVHFAAHSRGALITERGLELVAKTLEARGWTSDQIEKNVFSHVTVETFGGASTGFPKGVKAVHYMDPHDLVAQAFGMETPNAQGMRALGELAVIGGAPGAALAGMLDTQMLQKQALHVGLHAPGIGTTSVGSLNPITDLLNAHDFLNYIDQRKDFGVELARFEKRDRARESIAPDPAPGHVPAMSAFEDGKDHLVDTSFSRTGQMHDYGKFVGQTTEADGHSSVVMYPKDQLFAHLPASERAELTDAIAKHKVVTIGGRTDGSIAIAHAPEVHAPQAPSQSRGQAHGIGGRAD